MASASTVSSFGNVFEKTESVAQEAFETKPFKDFEDIINKMLTIYENYKKDNAKRSLEIKLETTKNNELSKTTLSGDLNSNILEN